MNTMKKDKTKFERYAELLEWMFVYDGQYATKNEWCENFIPALREAMGLPPLEMETDSEPKMYEVNE